MAKKPPMTFLDIDRLPPKLAKKIAAQDSDRRECQPGPKWQRAPTKPEKVVALNRHLPSDRVVDIHRFQDRMQNEAQQQ